jgi:hypothetical protein
MGGFLLENQMFKIVQNATYTWPVTVELPTDGGKTEKQTFDAEFKRLTQTRVDEIRQSVERGEMRDSELAREAMVGWSGIVDGDGGQVQFSEKSRDQLLDIPQVSGAVVTALLSSMSGAKRKN